jgi:hypothetical protein
LGFGAPLFCMHRCESRGNNKNRPVRAFRQAPAAGIVETGGRRRFV